MSRALIAFGTRPEAIKTAPIIDAMRSTGPLEPVVLVTGQHRDMLDQMLDAFDIVPDYDLDLMQPRQSIGELTRRVLEGLKPVLDEVRPSVVVVQGDTTTTFSAALCASYDKIPVAHVEAGYRTGDRYLPFPEELNRRLVSELAEVHYATNERCREALLSEGHDPDHVIVTGNTGIDALQYALTEMRESPSQSWSPDSRIRILMTLHRRESWGESIMRACQAARLLVQSKSDIELVFATHLNPVVREAAERELGSVERVRLVPPLGYSTFARLLDEATIVLSDSGGIHEEALHLGKPLLLLRDTTEWPEAVVSGAARLVGTDPTRIMREASDLIERLDSGQMPPAHRNALSDGRASERIVRDLNARFAGGKG